MGKRGPEPVSQQSLRNSSRQLFKAFLQIEEGSVSFNRARYFDVKEKLKKPPIYSTKLQADYDRRRANILEARFSGGESERQERLDKVTKHTYLAAIVDPDIQRLERHWPNFFRKSGARPEVIDELLLASTPEQVREVTARSFPPKEYGVIDPASRTVVETRVIRPQIAVLLDKHADSFITAKKDSRFPNSNYASNRRKQLWFVSRVLSGAEYGLRPRTSIDRVSALRRSKRKASKPK